MSQPELHKVKSLTPKQEERRQRILSAARDMVADHGYEGMVMSHVAEKAGVSPTTLYNLYNTKDQLVMESLRELLTQNTRSVRETTGGPGWQYLFNYIKSGARMANTSPSYAEAILVALQRARAGDELVDILLEREARGIQKSLDAMQAAGELKASVDTHELAVALTGIYWSSFIMWNKGLLRLNMLEHTIQMNFLSMLIPSTEGEARQALEDQLEMLG
jgi:AcrR family transcriptional regulator